jgi:hypothetical protein
MAPPPLAARAGRGLVLLLHEVDPREGHREGVGGKLRTGAVGSESAGGLYVFVASYF